MTDARLPHRSRLTRRTFATASATAAAAIGAGAATLPALAATPAASPDASPAASPAAATLPDSPLSATLPNGGLQADGTWAFTDDRGVTVTLPSTPEKVVAYVGFAAALYDLGYEVAAYFGSATNADGTPAGVAGRLPLDRIPSVATADDDYTVDVEKLVALGADLFVGPNYDITAEPAVIWPLDADLLAQVGQTAEVIYLAGADGADVERTIETIVNLAAALGVDTDTPAVAEAQATFQAAKEALAGAIAAKPNLTTLWIAGSATGFWTQSNSSDILFLRKLGVQFAGDDLGAVGEQSWETFATTWASDVLFNDDRQPHWWGVEQLTAEIPTFALHPAVAAGQVAPWRNTFVSSYAGFTPVMEQYTEVFLTADETVLP